jgi:acyl-CoA dehydrogenase
VGDEWALTGEKAWVSNGPLADWFVVFATTDISARKSGISAFLVDRQTPGVSTGRHEKKLGQRASPTASLILQDARAELLAEKGYQLALTTFGQTRPEIAAAATGLQRRALDESLEYAKQRHSFGVPLIEHQLVGAMLAEMHTRWLASCLLTQNAAAALDRGDDSPLASSAAKLFAADAAVATASDAIQIFGGNGYVRDYPVEKLLRDAKVLQIYEGTSQILKLVIAKSLGR